MSQGNPEDEENHIWVRSDVRPDGSYGVTIDFTQDDSITLTDEKAIEYAMAILMTAHIAAYEAAIFAQFRAAGIREIVVVQFIAESFRPTRNIPDTGTPLALIPGISQKTKEPFLKVMLHGKEAGQWDYADAISHARAVFDVTVVSGLDQKFYNTLAETLEMSEDKARAMVGGIARFRAPFG